MICTVQSHLTRSRLLLSWCWIVNNIRTATWTIRAGSGSGTVSGPGARPGAGPWARPGARPGARTGPRDD